MNFFLRDRVAVFDAAVTADRLPLCGVSGIPGHGAGKFGIPTHKSVAFTVKRACKVGGRIALVSFVRRIFKELTINTVLVGDGAAVIIVQGQRVHAGFCQGCAGILLISAVQYSLRELSAHILASFISPVDLSFATLWEEDHIACIGVLFFAVHVILRIDLIGGKGDIRRINGQIIITALQRDVTVEIVFVCAGLKNGRDGVSQRLGFVLLRLAETPFNSIIVRHLEAAAVGCNLDRIFDERNIRAHVISDKGRLDLFGDLRHNARQRGAGIGLRIMIWRCGDIFQDSDACSEADGIGCRYILDGICGICNRLRVGVIIFTVCQHDKDFFRIGRIGELFLGDFKAFCHIGAALWL